MAWKATCALLAALLLWACAALVKVENQRYALQSGMCVTPTAPALPDLQCLETVQTRSCWWWHLFYALTS